MMRPLTLAWLLVLGTAISHAREAASTNPLPAPSGTHKVGVTFRQWTDETRGEPFTADPIDRRVLSTWIYYPATVGDAGRRMPYVMDQAVVPAIQFLVVDFFGRDFQATFEALSRWESYAYRDAPVTREARTHPVVLLTSPAGVGASLQAVDLASRGYVVIDVLHSHGYASKMTDKGIKIGSFEATPSFAPLMELCVLDNRAVLDHMAAINAPKSGDLLAGRLDLTRIGIVGGSIGGGIARETAVLDHRITAGISEDGAFEPFAPTPLDQPFMYLYQDLYPGRYYQNSKAKAYCISFSGFRHDTFSDFIYWPGVKDHPRVLGKSVTSDRAHTVFTSYLAAFFDEHLRGIEQPLLDGQSEDFPEVAVFESMGVSATMEK